MLVLDSSVTLAWILDDETSGAESTLELMDVERASVPAHWILEVTNGLQMAVRRRRLKPESVAQLMMQLRNLPLCVDDQTEVMGWSEIPALAARYDLTTYDAAYLELAMRLDAPLATLDQDLAHAARAARVALFS
jgi:predicted nucleic acid-binding protein